jgi:AcrR family transcriptional regulator
VYPPHVPKLWNETIESHRRDVRAAVIAAATSLVAEHGLRGVTMSGIAAEAGIGRATLYKYFSDVESILSAWHEEQVAEHLTQMQHISSGSGTAQQRLARVLEAFAHMMRAAGQHSGPPDLVASLHAGDRLSKPETELRELLSHLIDEGVETGELRDDIPSTELALHCLNAAAGTRHAGNHATVRRLLEVAIAGLAPSAAVDGGGGDGKHP